MLHPLEDRERLRPLYAAQPLVTVRARHILYGMPNAQVRILVDRPDHPRGALVSHDGLLWDLYSPDPDVAHGMIDALEPPARQFIFVGVAEHLVDHVGRRFEVLVHTPTDLYVLAEPSDWRGPTTGTGPVWRLAPEHVEMVAAAWPHDDFEEQTGKLDYIAACIARGPTMAVVDQGRLVSFVLTHTDGSMGVLHTEPTHRRQGLGRRVVSALVNDLLARGAPVYGFVAVGNTASTTLFESLGLRAVQRGAWLTVRPARPHGRSRTA